MSFSSHISFRAPLITPRPIVHGPRTAKFVAEEGKNEEIDVDEHGRILVHFFWARGTNDPRRTNNPAACASRRSGRPQNGGVSSSHASGRRSSSSFWRVTRPTDRHGAVYNKDNKYP